MTDIDWREIEEKGRTLAARIGPDFVAVVDETLERWFEEHTSLDRREWETSYKPALRAGVYGNLARVFNGLRDSSFAEVGR